MPPRRFCSLYPIHLYILLLLCHLDASGFCHAGLSRRFWLTRFLFWRLASTMVVGYRARLSRFFRIYMEIVAVYFRDLTDMECRRFLFVEHSLAILEWDVSGRMIACV